MRQPVRTENRSLRLHFDVPLLLIVITLIVFGLLMVYSASTDFSYMVLGQAPSYMFFRQVMFMAAGIVAAVVISLIPYKYFQRLVVPAMGLVLLALLMVLVINRDETGVVRTLRGGSFQPGEFAKMGIVIYLSFWLSARQEKLNNISFGLLPLGVILGITGGLILAQPDISATATVFLLGAMMFFLAGGEWRQLVIVLVIAAVLGWLVLTFSSTGQIRLADYINGLRDPMNSSDHVLRSLQAIVKGGLFGVGLGQADTKFTGLPLPPTDSIFAVIAEELGLVGAVFVVGLFVALLWRGLTIAKRAPDKLGSLLAAGLTLWIVLEALINMAVIAGLFPVAGNALPFISAGGSNLLATLCAIGVIMNVARCSHEQQAQTEGRPFSAVVDLRGRNGGRRESRSRRSSSTRQ